MNATSLSLKQMLEKAGIKLDGKSKLYTPKCPDCVTHTKVKTTEHRLGYSFTGKGIILGEFKTIKSAQAAVNSHTAEHPLHRASIDSKDVITEYLTHTDKHMIRYRKYNDDIRVHSVNGYSIAGDKCAYVCKYCGAVYQSKAANCRSTFPTDDPKCKEEKHTADRISGLMSIEKICVCPSRLDDEVVRYD